MRSAIDWIEQQQSALLRVDLSNGWGAGALWEPELHSFLLTSSASTFTEELNKDVRVNDKGRGIVLSLLFPLTSCNSACYTTGCITACISFFRGDVAHPGFLSAVIWGPFFWPVSATVFPRLEVQNS